MSSEAEQAFEEWVRDYDEDDFPEPYYLVDIKAAFLAGRASASTDREGVIDEIIKLADSIIHYELDDSGQIHGDDFVSALQSLKSNPEQSGGAES